MRKQAFFSIVSTFLFLLSAQASALSQDAIAAYVEPSEQAETSQIQVASGTFTLATVDGTELLLFDESSQLVTSVDTIKQVFTEEFYANLDFDSRAESITASLLSFNASRKADEALCRQYTGTDRWPCTDHNSCLFACRSVPICATAMSTQAFTTEMKSFVGSTDSITSNVDAFLANSESMKGSIASVDAQITRANSMKSSVNTVKANKLFGTCSGCFDFCKPIAYNTNSLNSVLDSLNSLKAGLGGLSEVESRTSLLEEALQARLDYLETRGDRFQQLTTRTNNALNDLRGRKLSFEKEVSDSTVSAGFAELENTSSTIAILGNGKRFQQAFALEQGFFTKSATLNNSMARWLNESKTMQKAKEDCKLVLDRAGELLLENDELRGEFDDLMYSYTDAEKSSKKPVSSSRISGLKTEFKRVAQEGEQLITKKVLSGTPTGKTGSSSNDVDSQLEQAKKTIKQLGCPITTSIIFLTLFSSFALAVSSRRK